MNRRKRPLALVFAVSAVALAACDDVTVNRSDVGGNFSGYLYAQTQAAKGTNAVVVRNAPFTPDAVVAALRDRYTGNQYRFGLAPTPADWNGYTVVLGFGATVGNQNLCQNPNVPLAASANGRTMLVGNYCYGDRLLSEATGWTGALSGPDDPRFKDLVGGVVAELFSYRVQDPNGGGPSPPQ